MPAPVVQLGAVAMCAHAGQVQFVPTSPRVLLGGRPLVTQTDPAMVVGCTLNDITRGPPPCTNVY